MRQAVLLSAATAALVLSLPGWAQERGLKAPADALGAALLDSSRWQTRFERDDLAPRTRASLLPAMLSGNTPQTLRMFSDYQLDTLRFGQTGGLRLTGGLLVNLKASGFGAAEPSPTLPYAGIGYASGSAPGANGLQWGLSADLGLVAGGLGVSLANRSGATGLSVDGGLRDLRLQPMIRLGMNVSF